jgi:hypothetical protein
MGARGPPPPQRPRTSFCWSIISIAFFRHQDRAPLALYRAGKRGRGHRPRPSMIAASFGLLTPVRGALLQEVIDVAVIFNALRALRG